jgi:uncharacterized protein YpuA (DUF1002 family)
MNVQLRPEQASSVQAAKSRVANYDWTKVSEELQERSTQAEAYRWRASHSLPKRATSKLC